MNIPYKKKAIIFVKCMEVHGSLGKVLLEIVYKGAIEYELRKKKIS